MIIDAKATEVKSDGIRWTPPTRREVLRKKVVKAKAKVKETAKNNRVLIAWVGASAAVATTVAAAAAVKQIVDKTIPEIENVELNIEVTIEGGAE